MTKFGFKITLIDAGTSANANINTEAMDVNLYQFAYVQILTASLNASDGVFKLQDSNDGTNWHDIAGATVTVLSAAPSHIIRVTTPIVATYLRGVWTKNTVNAGTINVIVSLKK